LKDWSLVFIFLKEFIKDFFADIFYKINGFYFFDLNYLDEKSVIAKKLLKIFDNKT
jgi:hypothetical protein